MNRQQSLLAAVIVVALLACEKQFAFAQGIFSIASTTGGDQDANVGLDNTKTYFNAINVNGGNLTINGVSFTGNNGNATWSYGNFPNALVQENASSITGQFGTLEDSFRYGNVPAVQTVTLTGLTAGQTYITTFYNPNWDFGNATARTSAITSTSGATFSYNQNPGAALAMSLLRYTFVASGTSESINFNNTGAAGSTHLYGFTTEQAFNNNWTSGANWSTAVWSVYQPNAAGDNANFTAQGSPTAINVDVNRIVGHVQLDGANSWTVSGANTLTLQPDVGGVSVLSTPTGSHTISAQIAGANPIIKLGAGTLTLSGVNTYSSTTIFGAGTLNVAALSNYGVNGSLGNRASDSDGDVGLLFRGGTLQYTGATPTSTDRAIRVSTNSGAFLDASGSIPTATMSFTRNTASPDFFENSGNRQITFTGSNVGANTFAIPIQSAGGLTTVNKTGNGRWVLTGAGNYTGPTNIQAGVLQIENSTALGAGTFSANDWTVISNGASLHLNGNLAVTEHIRVQGNGTDGLGAIRSLSGTSSISQNMGLDGTTQFGVESGSQLTIVNQVYSAAGTPGLTKTGAGTLILSSANTYSGGTNISGGTLRAGNASALGTSSVSIANDTNLLLWWNTNNPSVSNNITLNGLGGPAGGGNKTSVYADGGGAGGHAEYTLAGSVTLAATSNLGGNDANNLRVSGVISGPGGLTKGGGRPDENNTLVLANPGNSYAGNTTITKGTLLLAASEVIPHGPGAGVVSVAAGTTLNLGGYNETINNLSGAGTVTSTASIASPVFFTNDAGTGLSAANMYTHAIDFGSAPGTVVNGVTFDNAGSWSLTGATVVTGNGATGATGSIASVLTNFNYNGNPGVLTLNGLTPGQTYEARLYQRQWGTTDRTNRMTLTSGMQSAVLVYNEDASATPSYLSFRYTAGASGSATIQTNVVGGGTYHWYGVTNQVIVAPVLTVGDATNSIFSGTITSNLGLTKQGSGTLTLSAANTYTGRTTVNSGTLEVDGSIDSSGEIVIDRTVGAAVNTNGRLLIDAGGMRALGNTANGTGDVIVGDNGFGYLQHGDAVGPTAATSTVGRDLIVGRSVGGNGLVEVNNGTTLNVNNQLRIGNSVGTGVVNVRAGGTLNVNGNTTIIDSPVGPNFGTLNVAGTYTEDGDLIVGQNATGIVNQTGGTAHVNDNLNSTGNLILGQSAAGALGTYNLQGGTLHVHGSNNDTSSTAFGNTNVGVAGRGVVNHTAGTFFNDTNMTVGGAVAGSQYNLSGTGVLNFLDRVDDTQQAAGDNAASTLTIGANGDFNLGLAPGGTLMNVTTIDVTSAPGSIFQQDGGRFVVGVDGGLAIRDGVGFDAQRAMTTIVGGSFDQNGGTLAIDIFGNRIRSRYGEPRGPNDPGANPITGLITDSDLLYIANGNATLDGTLEINLNGVEPRPWAWYDVMVANQIFVEDDFNLVGINLWRVINDPTTPGRQILQVAIPEPVSITLWSGVALLVAGIYCVRRRKT